MISTSTIFNKIVDCAYMEAFCYDMLGYYSSVLYNKLNELCAILNNKFVFATFSTTSIDFSCEFGIVVKAKPNRRLTPIRIDKISKILNQMSLSSFDEKKAVFYFDDEKYFENNFINNNYHEISGKKLVEKFGLELIE